MKKILTISSAILIVLFLFFTASSENAGLKTRIINLKEKACACENKTCAESYKQETVKILLEFLAECDAMGAAEKEQAGPSLREINSQLVSLVKCLVAKGVDEQNFQVVDKEVPEDE